MSDTSNFTNLEALASFIQNKEKGGILINYSNCEGYPGMVLALMIVFDMQKPTYELDLQWMSLGLDFYGDTLQESYVYRFESLEKLLKYLQVKFSIQITDIPIKYSFDQTQHPDYLKDSAMRPQFKAAWEKFQLDFRKGDFLDPDLELVYDSSN